VIRTIAAARIHLAPQRASSWRQGRFCYVALATQITEWRSVEGFLGAGGSVDAMAVPRDSGIRQLSAEHDPHELDGGADGVSRLTPRSAFFQLQTGLLGCLVGLLVVFPLGAENAAPVFVLSNGHAALDADAHPLSGLRFS
jgi:hypothetical protein